MIVQSLIQALSDCNHLVSGGPVREGLEGRITLSIYVLTCSKTLCFAHFVRSYYKKNYDKPATNRRWTMKITTNSPHDIAAIVAQVIQALDASKKRKQYPAVKARTAYTPKNTKAESFKRSIDNGLTERQAVNDSRVIQAYKRLGEVVTPRVDVMSYNRWLANGRRVMPGSKATYVKGVGSMFHVSQTVEVAQPTKAEMTAELATMTQPPVTSVAMSSYRHRRYRCGQRVHRPMYVD